MLVPTDTEEERSPAPIFPDWMISTSIPTYLECSADANKALNRTIVEESPSEPRAPTSPSSWTTSANVPLLSTEDEEDFGSEARRGQETSVNGKRNGEGEDGAQKPKAELSAFSNFIRIFAYATWVDKLCIFTAIAASICTGITLPLMNVVFANLVEVFNRFYKPATEAEQNDHRQQVFISTINCYVVYIVYLFLGRLTLDYAAIVFFRTSSIRISAAIRLAYLKSLFALPISTLDSLPSGQTSAIITTCASTLQHGISERISLFFHSLSLIITALIISFTYSWQLTLATSSGLLFVVVLYTCTLPTLVRGLKCVEEADLMSYGIAAEVLRGMRMVAACGAEKKVGRRFTDWVVVSRRRGLGLSSVIAIQQGLAFFAIHATFALSFWYAAKLYTESTISSAASMIIVLTSIMTIVMSISGIVSPIAGAAQAATSAGIFLSVIDIPSPSTHGIESPTAPSQEDIVFKNVNFTYPTRPDVKVLDNLNLRFQRGKRTAIVGVSGSGKSTIVALLERWYELDGNSTSNLMNSTFCSGSIKIGDRNLGEINLKWWRSQIGLVQQEPFLFNESIYKNVEYGLVGTSWEYSSKDEKKQLVRRACAEAFADEFITRLPDGYNTVVGDAGIKLSGGQRQRLAIARSIVKQPSILILDEATSAIDVEGEGIVQAALNKVSENRTTITIAHRLSTIMRADSIVVLQKGHMVQQGSHEELLVNNEGVYWNLVRAQRLRLDESAVNVGRSFVHGEGDDRIAMEEKPKGIELGEQSITRGIKDGRELQQKSFLCTFKLFLLEQKYQLTWYALMLLGAIGAGAAFPLHALLFAKLISLFNFTGDYLRSQANWWCFVFFILACGAGVCYYALGWSSNTTSFNITASYRRELFDNILVRPIAYFDEEDNSIGSVTARIAGDPTQLQQLLGINIAIVLTSVFNVAGCVAMSFYFGWKLTFFTLCSALPIILTAGFYRVRYETQLEEMNNKVFAESSKFATEAIGAFRTVSSLMLEEEICNRYARLLEDQTKRAVDKSRYSSFLFAMSDSIALLCMALVLWYGGELLANYEYSPFNYLVIYLAIVQGSTSAGQSLSFGPNITKAFAAANRIKSLRIKHTEDTRTMWDIDAIDEGEKGVRGVKIEFQNVDFGYPTRAGLVLKDLNMVIEEGQFAAIVGPSGSGKTSIISLLERFYQVQRGHILYKGTDIRTLPMSDYRKTMSLVAQEPLLFEGTIRDNVLLGIEDVEEHDELLLHQVCRDAGIHDFIISLPEGYKTAVGSRGVTLSGGQKQRISIARALIRKPRLLLLDEATSNLDSETEKSVQAVFERTAKGRTMIVVAHRLATVQNADIIFVLGNGRVVESGDHATLLRMKGVYYQMCQSQALN